MRHAGQLALLLLLVAAPAWADDRTTLAVMVGRGGAPWEQVEAAVGPVTYEVGCPEERVGLDSMQSWRAYDERTLKITLGKPGTAYRDHSILTALLTRGLDQAYGQCPIQENYTNGPIDRGDVGEAEIYGAPSDDAPTQLLARADGFTNLYGYWGEVEDVYADDEKQIAKAQEAARRDDVRAAEEHAQIVAQQALQQQRAANAAALVEAQKRQMDSFLRWAQLLGAGALALWLFRKREAIARWYYGLKPHPATTLVERAVYSGAEIDGALYERILRPVPGGRIEREVRGRQARDLTSQLRAHEAALQSEEAHVVETERRRVEQENAFLRAQAELLRAGVDHEIAAARVDELRKATRRT